MYYFGFCGPSWSGKTTAARMLANILRTYYASIILPFAASLKETAVELGWDGKKDERGRRLLQLLGTECVRDCIGEDVWVDLWRSRVAEIVQWFVVPDRIVVIADDVRFPNEAQTIRRAGGWIISREHNCSDGSDMIGEACHRSEVGLPPELIDFYLPRVEDLHRLPTNLDYIITQLISNGKFHL